MPIATRSFHSKNPATGETVWQGNEASSKEIDRTLQIAARAFVSWSHAPNQMRIDAVLRFGQLVSDRKDLLADAISLEVGTPLWESRDEIQELLEQITLSIDALEERAGDTEQDWGDNTRVITKHRPHGVTAVIVPFSRPASTAHGHILPALLSGNTVIYKPSEHTPLIGQLLASIWEEIDLPQGVMSLLQGGERVAQEICQHPKLRALFFTGTAAVGHALFADLPPELMVALELGGNNPLVVAEVEDVRAAAYLAVESAFITSGQRCSCARRFIVPQGRKGDQFLEAVLELMKQIKIGPYTDLPEPFMGPLISVQAAKSLKTAQADLLERGGTALRKLETNGAFATPGLIQMEQSIDEELFGPLVQVIRASNFHAALHEATQTTYGLTAGLLSDNPALYQHLLQITRAGKISWNTPLTNSSGRIPFGGVGHSGNHRPAGFYAIDSAVYPVVSIQQRQLRLPEQLKPGITW